MARLDNPHHPRAGKADDHGRQAKACISVVRPQKGAQQLINYSKSRIAETLAQAPVSPFMGVEGQFDGYEDQWASLNSVPRPVPHV
jgi:hypothetical protein